LAEKVLRPYLFTFLANSREFLEKHWFEDKSSTTYFLIGYADFLADFPRRLTLAVNLVKIGLSVRSGAYENRGMV